MQIRAGMRFMEGLFYVLIAMLLNTGSVFAGCGGKDFACCIGMGNALAKCGCGANYVAYYHPSGSSVVTGMYVDCYNTAQTPEIWSDLATYAPNNTIGLDLSRNGVRYGGSIGEIPTTFSFAKRFITLRFIYMQGNDFLQLPVSQVASTFGPINVAMLMGTSGSMESQSYGNFGDLGSDNMGLFYGQTLLQFVDLSDNNGALQTSISLTPNVNEVNGDGVGLGAGPLTLPSYLFPSTGRAPYPGYVFSGSCVGPGMLWSTYLYGNALVDKAAKWNTEYNDCNTGHPNMRTMLNVGANCFPGC